MSPNPRLLLLLPLPLAAVLSLTGCADDGFAAPGSMDASAIEKSSCSTTFKTDSGVEDLSADFASGTSSSPAAIDIDESGSLSVCAGTHYVNITLSSAVTELEVKGAGPSSTVLDGAGSGPIIEASAASGVVLNVKALALNDGLGADNGGVTFGGGINHTGDDTGVTGATISIKNTTFSNNNAGAGAGLYCSGCTLTIKDTSFEDNDALYSGGGLRAIGADANMKDAVFTGNTSGGDAGGFFFNGTASLKDIEASDNFAGEVGGGGCLVLAETDATGLDFHDNTAGGAGGGLFIPGHSPAEMSTLDLDNSSFEDNTAPGGYGGAIAFQFASTNIENVSFEGNSGGGWAGAIMFVFATGDLQDVSFADNDGGFFGGGAFASYFGAVTGDDVDFSSNAPDDVFIVDPPTTGGTSYTYDTEVSGLDCDDSTCTTD